MNDQNLKPQVLSTEEASRIGKIGGIASAKAKKEKAIISSMYARFLAKKTKVNIDGKPATGEKLFEYAVMSIISKGNDGAKVALMKEMREALEGSKVAITNQDGGPFGVLLLSREEAQARLDELRAKQDA
jgi:hypothetical protein